MQVTNINNRHSPKSSSVFSSGTWYCVSFTDSVIVFVQIVGMLWNDQLMCGPDSTDDCSFSSIQNSTNFAGLFMCLISWCLQVLLYIYTKENHCTGTIFIRFIISILVFCIYFLLLFWLANILLIFSVVVTTASSSNWPGCLCWCRCFPWGIPVLPAGFHPAQLAETLRFHHSASTQHTDH